MKSDLHNAIKNKKTVYVRYNMIQVEIKVELEMRKGKISQIWKMDINSARS